MAAYTLASPPGLFAVQGLFDDSCQVHLDLAAEAALRSGQAKLSVLRMGQGMARQARIRLGAFRGRLQIGLGGDHTQVEIASGCSGNFDLKLWQDSEVQIGEGTSANSVRILCQQSSVSIGRDCMISDDVVLQSADQHGIVDLRTGRIVNHMPRSTRIGEHVWLGRRCTVLPDVAIGNGSIVGSDAVVSRDVPALSVCAGTPARVLRSGVSWTRNPYKLDDYAQALVQRHAGSSPVWTPDQARSLQFAV